MVYVSIILPTWNRCTHISHVIRSILHQTFRNFELLICDDGSTDNTKEIVLNTAKKDSRVIWLGGSHTGLPSVPRNRGIKNAKGKYLAFIDSDDIWDKDKLKIQIEKMVSNNIQASCTNAITKDKLGNKKILLSLSKSKIKLCDLLQDNKIITSTCMVNKNLIDKLNGFSTENTYKAIEDYFLWLKVATKTDFLFINSPLVQYELNSPDSIRKLVNGGEEQRMLVIKNFKKWLILNPDLRINYLRAIKNTFLD